MEPSKKVKRDTLNELKMLTQIVADTGDFKEIEKYQPIDSTTNPSLILQASNNPQYCELIDLAIKDGINHFSKSKDNITSQQKQQLISDICDRVAVKFGVEISKLVPGVVSTEVDSRLSFDTQATVAKAKQIIQLYKEYGVDKSKILIKIAATWEGIEAAKQLKRSKINCNLTLIFSDAQAIACGLAGVYLISPFVGRILDWHKANIKDKDFTGAQDPGVVSVSQIYNYFKKHDIKTIIMGASFRNTEEIIQLAGCDKLTISPKLLEELSQMEQEVVQKLDENRSKSMDIEKQNMKEKDFRWSLNQNAMATEKLAEGIRKFTEDQIKLEKLIQQKIDSFL